MGLFLLDSRTDPLFPPAHKSTRSTSRSKMFCAWIFARRNICGKLLKAASFVKFIVTSTISLSALVRIGSGHIFTQYYTPLIHSSMWQTSTEGCAQPPERRNVPPLHTLTRSPDCVRTLIFGFRKWKSLRIRHPVFQLHPATPLEVPEPLSSKGIQKIREALKTERWASSLAIISEILITLLHHFCFPWSALRKPQSMPTWTLTSWIVV